MRTWEDIGNGIKNFFGQFGNNWVEYVLQLLVLSVVFYLIFKTASSGLRKGKQNEPIAGRNGALPAA